MYAKPPRKPKEIPADLTDALIRMRDVQAREIDPVEEDSVELSGRFLEQANGSLLGHDDMALTIVNAEDADFEVEESSEALANGTTIAKRDDRAVYRAYIQELPQNWSSRIVACVAEEEESEPGFADTIDADTSGIRLSQRRDTHEVLFLWSKPNELFVYDRAKNTLCGPEIEAQYSRWEVSPSDFGLFLNGNRRYPDRGARSRRIFFRR